MNYDELVRKHAKKLIERYPNSVQFGNCHIKEELITIIKTDILIHCLVKVEGSADNAQKTLEKITLEAVEENIDHPTHIDAGKNIFEELTEIIKKLT